MNIEAILRQCMADTPADHPDKAEIDRRLADPTPIVAISAFRWNDYHGAINPKLTIEDIHRRWNYVCRRLSAALTRRTQLADAWRFREDGYFLRYKRLLAARRERAYDGTRPTREEKL